MLLAGADAPRNWCWNRPKCCVGGSWGESCEDRRELGIEMSKYNTNLAAEFYVLSMLHRLGAEATLTLANRKAVDASSKVPSVA